jgi:predicted nuclease of predicted toxin-antitoxin system
MHFIVDESTGSGVVELLRSGAHDVLAVSETMPQAQDQDILARAVREKRILVTNDKDFGELVYRSGQAHYGVVLLRLHDESPTNRVRILRALIDRYSDRLVQHFTVATEGSVRIRPSDPLS